MTGVQDPVNVNLSTTGRGRIQSVDLLRGLVMVLMAIDHVRVYSGLPAGGQTAGIFFTRWVTHFCVSGFVFLAGTSIFLYALKLNNKTELSRYLITRGLLLILLELTLIKFFWTFGYTTDFILAGVIWMIGWCMVLMAALVRLRPAILGTMGLGVMFGQQVFARMPEWWTGFGWFWEFIYPSGMEGLPGIAVLYSIVPWIGVMAVGYWFGKVLQMDIRIRTRFALITGLTATVLFLIFGTVKALRTPEEGMPFLFQLLNQNKYPASPLFLLMTLGPLIALLPHAERASGWLARLLIVFGKVPFFYYVLHILLIHVSALVVNTLLYGNMYSEWYTYAPFTSVPGEFQWSLTLLYLVFVLNIALLYVVCRWYAAYKFSHSSVKWLKYV